MFFAYVGFDAVSTAAEETKDPQRNVPIGLIGSLLFCTVFYILVAAGAIGTIGGQPIMGSGGLPVEAGSAELARQCAMPQYANALVCSKEALAHVLREIGFSGVGNMLGVAAFLALPSVILVLLFGQTRIFFVMSRDGLLPDDAEPGSPTLQDAARGNRDHRVAGGIGGGFLPGRQARRHFQRGDALCLPDGGGGGDDAAADRSRAQTFVPRPCPVAYRAVDDCRLHLPVRQLADAAMLFLPAWSLIGIIVYFLYSRRNSHLGRGIVEVHEDDYADIEPPIPGTHG